MTMRSVVTLYSHRNADDDTQRRYTFKVPETIPVAVLLDKGIAVKGKQAAFTISMASMAEELTSIIAMFKEYGCQPDFKLGVPDRNTSTPSGAHKVLTAKWRPPAWLIAKATETP